MSLIEVPFQNFYYIFTLWLRIIQYLYLIHIIPYLSTWCIRLYIHGLRMLFKISKDQLILHDVKIPRIRSYNSIKASSNFEDAVNCIRNGMQAIVADDVTEYFTTQQFQYWNLMNRNHLGYSQQNSHWLRVLFCIGLCFRYFLLFPVRILVGLTGFFWLIISFGILGMLYSRIPQDLYLFLKNQASRITGRLFIKAFSGHITFESTENRPTIGSICVANHTTPLDVMVLSVDNAYSMVGQSQGGFFGLLQWACSIGKPEAHVWFNR